MAVLSTGKEEILSARSMGDIIPIDRTTGVITMALTQTMMASVTLHTSLMQTTQTITHS